MHKIETWVAKLKSPSLVRVSIGANRQMQTIALLSIDGEFEPASDIEIQEVELKDLAPCILEALDGSTYPEIDRTFRLYSYSQAGKQTSSLMHTHKPAKEVTGRDMAIENLTTCIVSMASIMQRSVAQLSDSLTSREATLEKAIASMISAQEEKVEAENLALQSEIMASMGQGHDVDPLQETAVNAIGEFVSSFAYRGKPSPQDVANWAKEDPFFAQGLQEEFLKSQAEQAPPNSKPKT